MCKVIIYTWAGCGDETFERFDCKRYKQAKGNISLWDLVRRKRPEPCPNTEYLDTLRKTVCGKKDCKLKKKDVGIVPLKYTARGTTGFRYEDTEHLPTRRPQVPPQVYNQTRANAAQLIDRSRQAKRPGQEYRPVRNETGNSGRHRPSNDRGHHDRGHHDRPHENRQRVARPPSPRVHARTENTQHAGYKLFPTTTRKPEPQLRRTNERYSWMTMDGTAADQRTQRRPTGGRARPDPVMNDEGTRMGRVKEREVIARKPRHIPSQYGLVMGESYMPPLLTRREYESRLPTPKPQVPMKSPFRENPEEIVRPPNPRPSYQRERKHRPMSGYDGGHEVRKNSATRIPAPQLVNRHGYGDLTGRQQPPRESHTGYLPKYVPNPVFAKQPVPPPARYPPRAPTTGYTTSPAFTKRPAPPPPPPKKKKEKTNWFKKCVRQDSDNSSLDFKCVGV